MPPEVKNGKVTLETDKSLPLYGQKRPTLKRQASVIKATQEGDQKKFIFQVTRPTLHTHKHTHTSTHTHNIHQTKKQYTHYHEGQTGGEKFIFQVTPLPPPYTQTHTHKQHTLHTSDKEAIHTLS